ncbi:MAG: hypothetical protein QNK03_23490, partial [Myxococcota bacterium]|nr:hypothetical protein [Myxococcota bacterium]
EPDTDDVPARGFVSEGSDQALRAAFAYRGDVTLTLDDGSQAEGYVSNLREAELELWERGTTRVRRIARARIHRVALSGADPASGRSWETWMRAQREREASRAVAP